MEIAQKEKVRRVWHWLLYLIEYVQNDQIGDLDLLYLINGCFGWLEIIGIRYQSMWS